MVTTSSLSWRLLLAGSAILIAIAGKCVCAQGSEAATGVFQNHEDVGSVLHPGGVEYDASSRTYTVAGSGENMWLSNDDFQFAWKKVSG